MYVLRILLTPPIIYLFIELAPLRHLSPTFSSLRLCEECSRASDCRQRRARRGGELGCDPGGGVCEGGGEDCVLIGVLAEDSSACDHLLRLESRCAMIATRSQLPLTFRAHHPSRNSLTHSPVTYFVRIFLQRSTISTSTYSLRASTRCRFTAARTRSSETKASSSSRLR